MVTVKELKEKYNVKPSTRENKKYMITTKEGKNIHFGEPKARIVLGGKKQKSYCARSKEIKTSKNSPNYYSRKMWNCE